MTLPGWLRAVLPGDTAHTWEAIRAVVPDSGYLVGGTAIAEHLRHRVSRDLDFFLVEPVDLTVTRHRLEAIGQLALTLHTEDTLNGPVQRHEDPVPERDRSAGHRTAARGRGDPGRGNG